jgi:hypothetical protein
MTVAAPDVGRGNPHGRPPQLGRRRPWQRHARQHCCPSADKMGCLPPPPRPWARMKTVAAASRQHQWGPCRRQCRWTVSPPRGQRLCAAPLVSAPRTESTSPSRRSLGRRNTTRTASPPPSCRRRPLRRRWWPAAVGVHAVPAVGGRQRPCPRRRRSARLHLAAPVGAEAAPSTPCPCRLLHCRRSRRRRPWAWQKPHRRRDPPLVSSERSGGSGVAAARPPTVAAHERCHAGGGRACAKRARHGASWCRGPKGERQHSAAATARRHGGARFARSDERA